MNAQIEARNQRAAVRKFLSPDQIALFIEAMKRWKKMKARELKLKRRVTFADQDEVVERKAEPGKTKVKSCKATDHDAASRIEAVKDQQRKAIHARINA